MIRSVFGVFHINWEAVYWAGCHERRDGLWDAAAMEDTHVLAGERDGANKRLELLFCVKWLFSKSQ